MHDIAVIGLGMMGAATTRHLASRGVNVEASVSTERMSSRLC